MQFYKIIEILEEYKRIAGEVAKRRKEAQNRGKCAVSIAPCDAVIQGAMQTAIIGIKEEYRELTEKVADSQKIFEKCEYETIKYIVSLKREILK